MREQQNAATPNAFEANTPDSPLFLVVDCFCGAGGVTTGFCKASIGDRKIAKVVACINHDRKAIKSHLYNHPDTAHYHEDIRTLDLAPLKNTVQQWQRKYPNALLVLWASLECTNFSKAKAGKPKNADSRTLAEHLYRYIDALNPHYIQIENVVEFMSWGPLDDNGKPIDKQNGRDWLKWRQSICRAYGYVDCWRQLNSANLGAHTNRNRLFGIFAKKGLPIQFPEITHSKADVLNDLFTATERWKPIKDVLHLESVGTSIFGRGRPLSEKTLMRIYDGLKRYVTSAALDNTFFLTHYYGNGFNTSIYDPLPTITTKERAGLVVAHYGACNKVIGERESPAMQKIVEFMLVHNLEDISMRMLTVDELLLAQGFPKCYRFEGTAGDKVKFIGNSVVPIVVKKWVEVLAQELINRRMAA